MHFFQKNSKEANNAVNADAFFVRCAYYKCAGRSGP